MPYDQIMQALGASPQPTGGGSLRGPQMDAYDQYKQRSGQGAEMGSFHEWLRGIGINLTQLQPDQLMSYYQMWKQMMMTQQQVNQGRG